MRLAKEDLYRKNLDNRETLNGLSEYMKLMEECRIEASKNPRTASAFTGSTKKQPHVKHINPICEVCTIS